MKRLFCAVILAIGLFGLLGASKVQPRKPAEAADFPPGAFSDGGQYHLSDFRGKLLVLFFYENDCPTCKGTIPDRNKIVAQYKDKPVKFIAISPHEPMSAVKGYILETHLAMPVFADPLNVMESLYDQKISLHNIFQFRIIGPQGNIISNFMDARSIDAALAGAKWKYKDGGFDPALSQAIDLFEWNQYEAGMRLLQPLRKSSSKAVAASAEKLYQAIHAEGDTWKADADAALGSDPVKAFDLYTRLSSVFDKDDLGKTAGEALKKLKDDKTVKSELAARERYAQLYTVLPRADAKQKPEAVAFCKQIAEKFPNTPTAEKASRLADALEHAPVPGE